MTDHDYVAGIERIVQAEARRLGIDEPKFSPAATRFRNSSHEIDIDLPGWTPTLHHHVETDQQDIESIAVDLFPWSDDTEQAWGLTGIAALDVTISARMMLHYMEPLFAEQVKRANAARRLGIHAPIADLSDVSHVRLDRWTRDALVTIGRDPATTVREMLKALHGDGNFVPSVEMEAANSDLDTVLLEHAGHPLPLALIGLPVRPAVTFDGESVMIEGIELPETAITAAVGRRLDEVADSIPDLGHRRVIRAEGWITFYGTSAQGKTSPTTTSGNHIPVLKLWLEPDPVPVEG